MSLDALRYVRAEAHIVLFAVVAPRKMNQVHGADYVPMTAVIEEVRQNGTFSVSTMYLRFRVPRGMRLIRNPPRLRALRSAFSFEL